MTKKPIKMVKVVAIIDKAWHEHGPILKGEECEVPADVAEVLFERAHCAEPGSKAAKKAQE